MSRIAFHHFSCSPQGGEWSEAQLELDAQFSSFTREASNLQSIATYSLAGFVGRALGRGLLSLGAEAAVLTAIQGGSFASNFVNFGTFRLFGHAFRSQNSFVQHGIQSAAMVAGHQAAAVLKLEEASSASFSQQFLQASVSTLQIGIGNFLGTRLSGGRLQRVERNLGQRTHGTASFSFLPSLPSMSTEGRSGRERTVTDPLTRFARDSVPPTDQTAEVLKEEITHFSDQLEGVLNLTSSTLQQFGTQHAPIDSLFQAHGHLLKRNWNQGFRQLLDHFATQIRHFENQAAAAAEARRTFLERPTEPPPAPQNFLSRMFGIFKRNPPPSEIRASQEAPPVESPPLHTQELRERVYKMYDQLILMQECLRIVWAQKSEWSEPETKMWELMLHSYEGLHEEIETRRARIHRTTTILDMNVRAEEVDQWGDAFLANILDPKLARNVQAFLGRIPLALGELMGGDFHQTLLRAKQGPQEDYWLIKVFYDLEEGQVVAFSDESSQFRDTLTNLRRRGRRLLEVTYWIEPEETGHIMRSDYEKNGVRDSVQSRIEGLQGLQVLPAIPILGRESPTANASNQWIISRKSYGNRAFQYNIHAITIHPTNGILLTLNSVFSPARTLQLWLSREEAPKFQVGMRVSVRKYHHNS